MDKIDNNEQRVPRSNVLIFMPGAMFLTPYMEREFSGMNVVTDLTDDIELVGAVMISTTDVYDVCAGQLLDETTPLKADNDIVKVEKQYTEYCSRRGLKPTILRAANIIATGMEGFPMRLARGLVRMTMFKIRDNEACVSLVHGVDVARAAKSLIASGETFNLTDNFETPISEMLDALAHRIQDKRVYTIKRSWARLLYGKTYLAQLTTTLTFSGEKARAALDFTANRVTEYLLNHEYNDESL